MKGINLLPWREQKRLQKKNNLLISVFISIMLIISIIFVWHVYLIHQIKIQSSLNQDLQNEISILQQDKLANELRQAHTALKKALSIWQVINKDKNNVLKLLNIIPTVLPDEVYLEKIIYIANLVTIEGKAYSTDDVSTLLNHLKKLPSTTTIALTQINLDSKHNQSFTIQFRIAT